MTEVGLGSLLVFLDSLWSYGLTVPLVWNTPPSENKQKGTVPSEIKAAQTQNRAPVGPTVGAG